MNPAEYYKTAFEQTKAERDDLLAALDNIFNAFPSMRDLNREQMEAIYAGIEAVNKANGL